MSLRTGIDIPLFAEYGGLTGSATVTQLNSALDVAWEQVEEFLGTNIVVSTETEEMHLWPKQNRDWNQVFDTVRLKKHHLVSVTTVTSRHDQGDCSCSTEDFTGCSIIRDLETSLVDIRDCNASAAQNCNCGRGEPLLALITYRAGLFSTAVLDASIELAVSMIARQVLNEILAKSVNDMGAFPLKSWNSMDYGETRGNGIKRTSLGNNYISDYVSNLLKKYRPKIALSLHRTY